MCRSNQFYLAYLLKLSKYSNKVAKKSDGGFTLLELLITVVIIGILSSISIPAYVATVDKFHYGKAQIQMGCLKRELEGYRIENGYFPADVFSNTVPVGIECFYQQNTEQVPFDSKYDYENWQIGGGCVIQITFLGKDKIRNTRSNTDAYQAVGFHKFTDNDDLILSLGLQDSSVCSP